MFLILIKNLLQNLNLWELLYFIANLPNGLWDFSQDFKFYTGKFYDNTLQSSKDKILSKPGFWQKIYQGMSEKLESRK